MGSASLPDAEPATMSEKNTFKNLIKKPLQALFRKKKGEKLKVKEETRPINIKHNIQEPIHTDIDALKRNLEQLYLSKKAKDNTNDGDNEFKNFTVKLIEENPRDNTRLHSNCSEDSGFSEQETLAETTAVKEDELAEELEGLQIKDVESKEKKKLQKIYIARAPIRNKDEKTHVHPYQQPIQQVNRALFSGSQVYIENQPYAPDDYDTNYNEADGAVAMGIALTKIDERVRNLSENPDDDQLYWVIAQEYVEEKSQTNHSYNTDSLLSEFPELENVEAYPTVVQDIDIKAPEESNPLEDFANSGCMMTNDEIPFPLNDFDNELISSLLTPPGSNEGVQFLQSPSSTVQFSPSMTSPSYSAVQFSPSSINSPSPTFNTTRTYSNASDYNISPAMSSTNLSKNDDLEKYQDLTQIEEFVPTTVIENERNMSKKNVLSMKQFKDMQSRLSAEFAKKSCCSPIKIDCKTDFKSYFDKLSLQEKDKLCHELSSLDVASVYGVCHHIIMSLQKSSHRKDFQMALFGLILERILDEKPSLFLKQHGIILLNAAALRCPNEPKLTRYVVHCVRAALRIEGRKLPEGKPVFNEVDVKGDTLICALCRRGDEYAEVLGELLRDTDPPLFDVRHTNSEGKTALHLACEVEGDDGKRSTVCAHVLLAHGKANLQDGDIKNGDTAIHAAVSSITCSLDLVLTLFAHADRKLWKSLAHQPNRSSKSPLDSARTATKSKNRTDYPEDVLDFLKKCR